MKFSVLMTVYNKEKPEHFDKSLNSILVEQSTLPDQFVLVCDGPLEKELMDVVNKYKDSFEGEFTLVKLDENVGQGAASKKGVEFCKHDLIARMDSDDISYNYRFAEQLSVFESSDVDVVGGNISEFIESEDSITGYRITKEKHDDIVKEFHKRNPVNNMTVMFKKQALVEIGGYSTERVNEDFNLYIRFLLANKKFYNIQKPLVNVRAGNEMMKRRSDISVYRAWKRNQAMLLNGRIINRFEYCRNCFKCYLFVKCPVFIKKFFYKVLLRKKSIKF